MREKLFIILTYDVNEKRVSKVMKVCRKYLKHVHRSVFEGSITDATLDNMKKELERIVDVEMDSVCIYKLNSVKYTHKETLGKTIKFGDII